MKLKFLTLGLLIISSGITNRIYASDKNEVEYKNMEQMIGSIRLEKKQVESMINKMVASGRLSAEDGMKAKREIASVKESDMENLKTFALAEVKNKKN